MSSHRRRKKRMRLTFPREKKSQHEIDISGPFFLSMVVRVAVMMGRTAVTLARISTARISTSRISAAIRGGISRRSTVTWAKLLTTIASLIASAISTAISATISTATIPSPSVAIARAPLSSERNTTTKVVLEARTLLRPGIIITIPTGAVAVLGEMMRLLFRHVLGLVRIDPIQTFCLDEFVDFCHSYAGKNFLRIVMSTTGIWDKRSAGVTFMSGCEGL
jgi:hypothetical protein